MKSLKPHFKFNKQERSGVFYLLLIIILLQIGYFVYQSFSISDTVSSFSSDEELQANINVLKEEALKKDSVEMHPFNPNFITDYKGYVIGMSVEEIDKLHAFRSNDKYVNSSKDFQRVTKVSDSLLKVISPYFKFPEWKKQYSENKQDYVNSRNKGFIVKDINSATAEELRLVNGVGEKLSARIVKFRDRLGGFLINEQLFDVYGLEPQVVERVLKKFKVLKVPSIKKININSASIEELQKLIYIQKIVAIGIVNYRNDNKTIDSFEELTKIEHFPIEKIDRIILYLSL